MIIPDEIWQALPALSRIRPAYRKDALASIISHYGRLGFKALMADLPAEYRAESVTFQGPKHTATFTAADEPVIVAVPTMVDKAVNLFSALPGILNVASPEVAAKRVATCNGCDYLGANRACRVCGCPVDTKATFAGEACPKGLWP